MVSCLSSGRRIATKTVVFLTSRNASSSPFSSPFSQPPADGRTARTARRNLHHFWRSGAGAAAAWKDAGELADVLSNNVVYYDPENDRRGLLAVNKPSGLPVRGCDDCPCGLTDALPGLASRVGAKRVFYVRAPERFTSGVALLSTSEKGAEHLRRCLLRARGMKLFHDSYLAVTSGLPRLGGGGGGQAAEEVLDVLSKRCDVTTPVFGKYHVEPVITRYLRSKTFLRQKREDSLRYRVRLESLSHASAGPAALVRMESTSVRHNFPAVYLADMLSPMLGDRFYSYRARLLMGHMARVSHRNSPHAFHQSLPGWMLHALGLTEAETALLPKHLHLARTHLPHYFGKERNLSVFADPPEFFSRTLEALDIKFSMPDFSSEDKVRGWSHFPRGPDPSKSEAGVGGRDAEGEEERPGATHRPATMPPTAGKGEEGGSQERQVKNKKRRRRRMEFVRKENEEEVRGRTTGVTNSVASSDDSGAR